MGYYNKKWNYWKAEIVSVHIDREATRFHKRHLFDVVSLESRKKYIDMELSPHSEIRKRTIPKEGDIVLMKYCKHKYDIDDNISESRIIKTISVMDELLKYTDEEISREFYRRRSLRIPKYNTEWNYWEAEVLNRFVCDPEKKKVSYRYGFKLKPISGIRDFRDKTYLILASSNMKVGTMPRIGDIVKLRYKKHKIGADFSDESKIVEVLKRKEDVD